MMGHIKDRHTVRPVIIPMDEMADLDRGDDDGKKYPIHRDAVQELAKEKQGKHTEKTG